MCRGARMRQDCAHATPGGRRTRCRSDRRRCTPTVGGGTIAARSSTRFSTATCWPIAHGVDRAADAPRLRVVHRRRRETAKTSSASPTRSSARTRSWARCSTTCTSRTRTSVAGSARASSPRLPGSCSPATPESGLYLFVLEQNTPAQAFYAARGGIEVAREIRGPFPGGGTAPSLGSPGPIRRC